MSRQTIKLGVPFTCVRPSAGEKEFVVENLHDSEFDSLKATIQNSTSYPSPQAFVTDEGAKVIKLKGFDMIPQTMSLEIIVQGVVAQKNVTVEQKTLFSDETLDNIKQAPANVASAFFRYAKQALILFCVGSFLLYMVKETEVGGAANEVWKNANAAQFIEFASDLDLRIATNKHKVYETHTFMQMNAGYKKRYGDDKDLRSLYNFIGDIELEDGKTGFFIMKDVVKNNAGLPMLISHGDAEEHCDMAGGFLPMRSDMTALAGQYLGVENFIWPIQRRSDVREWASESYSWLFGDSWLFLKEAGINPTQKQPVNGFVPADNDTPAAFRCVMLENMYMAAK